MSPDNNAPADLELELGERSYHILIGDGLLASAGQRIKPLLNYPRTIIITDKNVEEHCLQTLEKSLSEAGIRHHALVLPPGEQTKDFPHLIKLVDQLLAAGIDRRTMLIAFGGGVIGDIAGFAAAITLRGLDFIQIPTTLLAQVDSSVGGKTGINSGHGKNLIGAFHQPRLVLADIAALDSLPRREILAGYAEIVKYGLINDPEFFAWCEANGKALVDGNRNVRRYAVSYSCTTKANFVAEDECEGGKRTLLNLGHTFAHALESEAQYDNRLLHGEAVAIGCVLAFKLSARLGLCSERDGERVSKHLLSVGLPVSLAAVADATWTVQRLVGHMIKDKKVVDGNLVFVLARRIGDTFICHEASLDDAAAVLGDALKT